MNRFNRDFALVSNDGKILMEAHNATRLETMRQELAVEGIVASVVKSDLPRR